jgi:hypothetical protein
MFRRRTAVPLLSLTIVACGGLKDALTSHVDVAARAGSQELSATRLAEMMQSANMPPRKDLAVAVANLWTNYQLLAQAAGHSDTLGDAAVADDAMWAQIAQRKLQKYMGTALKEVKEPTAAELAAAYDRGEGFLVARHILVLADKNLLKPAQIDSARRVAEGIRRQATPANFVALVKRHSGDPGSKDAGGEYVFPAGQMVPEFEQATRNLKPGAMSDPVQTNYGFHIILRETYEEAKPRFDSAYQSVARQRAESTWLAGVDAESDTKVKDDAPKIVRQIVDNVDAWRSNRSVLATSNRVDLRASRVAHWIAAFPPQMRIRQQLAQLPDSALPDFLKQLVRNEVLLKMADDAKVILDSAETNEVRSAFRRSVQNTMGGLGILPSQLADSAGATPATVATARVNAYFDRLLQNQVQFIDVSEPLAIALRRKYEGRVTESGIDRAVTLASELKARADSAANAAMPPTAVPTPGAPGAPTASGADTAKAPTKK